MANEGTVVVAPIAPSGLFIDALDLFLMQNKSFLTAQELGLFSCCGRDVQNLITENAVWTKVFLYVAEACKTYEKDGRSTPRLEKAFPKEEDDQTGLPECFQDPDERILAKVGYKAAVRCLLSQQCAYCCEMTGKANPLTMTRTCLECAMEVDEEDRMIADERARKEFLLEDDELASLPSAGYAGTRLFSLSEVKTMSLAKWGGIEGHRAELLRRARGDAVDMSEQLRAESQYLDHLRYLEVTEPLVVSIGSVHDNELRPNRTPKLMMSCSYGCPECNVSGNLFAVARHARLEHGFCVSCDGIPPETEAPLGLAQVATIDVPQELADLIGMARIKYGFRWTETIMGIPLHNTEALQEFGWNDLPVHDPQWIDMMRQQIEELFGEETVQTCTITFPCLECTIAVDYEHSPPANSDSGWGQFTIYCQLSPDKVPFELLYLGIGESFGSDREATAPTFKSLLSELDLQHTSPSQLLAALVVLAVPLLEFFDKVLDDDHAIVFENPSLHPDKMPLSHGAYKILETAECIQTMRTEKNLRPFPRFGQL